MATLEKLSLQAQIVSLLKRNTPSRKPWNRPKICFSIMNALKERVMSSIVVAVIGIPMMVGIAWIVHMFGI